MESFTKVYERFIKLSSWYESFMKVSSNFHDHLKVSWKFHETFMQLSCNFSSNFHNYTSKARKRIENNCKIFKKLIEICLENLRKTYFPALPSSDGIGKEPKSSDKYFYCLIYFVFKVWSCWAMINNISASELLCIQPCLIAIEQTCTQVKSLRWISQLRHWPWWKVSFR